jgi:flagellar motility protein MotE (MotC chaperone)
MKKIFTGFEILVVFLFMVKLFAIGEIVKRSELYNISLWSINPAMADSHSQTTGSTLVRDAFEDTLKDERNLMVSLEDRRRQLEDRENFIRFEGKRLNSLKKEIVAKIEVLHGREEKTTVSQESDKEENKRIKELAKEYDATPPDKVATLFSKMDNKTAAGIIMQMKNKKAGAVWEYFNPEKAVEIAKTITNM